MGRLINLQNLLVLSHQNLSFVREILEVYLANNPKDIDALKKRVDNADWEHVGYYVHKLKSSSLTIGFNEGCKIYQEMESRIKDNDDLSDMPTLMDRAVKLCDQASIEIKIYLAENA